MRRLQRSYSDEPCDLAVESSLLEPDGTRRLEDWAAEILQADAYLAAFEPDLAVQVLEAAWRASYDRQTQAATMLHLGRARWIHDQPDAAAGAFELARALRRGFADPALVASAAAGLAMMRERRKVDAIVLSGGAGRRFGGPGKPEYPLAGWPLLDHVLLAAAAAGTRVVAGPRRRGLGDPVFVTEDPPGSGPVAGLAAALPRVTQSKVLVLAADAPFIGEGIAPLCRVADAHEVDAAVFVSPDGTVQYLAAVWHTEALARALDRLGDPAGAPLRLLYDQVSVGHVPDFDHLAADCDTPADLAAAQRRIVDGLGATTPRYPGQLPASPLAWPGLDLAAPS